MILPGLIGFWMLFMAAMILFNELMSMRSEMSRGTFWAVMALMIGGAPLIVYSIVSLKGA